MSQIAQLEALKVDRRKDIDLRDQVLRLAQNPDFRAIFDKEFCEVEAGRLVRAAGDPNLPEKERNDCIQMALATGHVKRFLSTKVQMGNHAEQDLITIDEQLEELRAEGGDEE